MSTLRGGRREDGGEDLGGQLAGGGLDLAAGLGALSGEGLLGCMDTLLGSLAGRGKSGFALGVPLMDALFAAAEDLGAGSTEAGVVLLGANVSLGDGEAGLFQGPRGALAALGAHFHELAIEDEAVGEDQEGKEDQGRQGTDCKISKLAQQFIHRQAGFGCWEASRRCR